MTRRADFTVMANGTTPQPGVYVTVKAAGGALAAITTDGGAAITGSTVLSGGDGSFYYNAADGAYTEEYRLTSNGAVRKVLTVTLDSTGPAAAASAAAAATSAAQAATSAAAAAANPGAKSATTTALIAAIRNNAFFPQPSFRTAANDVATITVPAAFAASTLNANNYAVANVPVTNTAKITWLSGASLNSAAYFWSRGAYYTAGGRGYAYNSFEFNHTGTAFEITLATNQLNSGSNFRVLVADKIAGTATLPVGGEGLQVKATFPVSALRRIRIEMTGGIIVGVNVAAVGEVTATGRTYPLVTLIGDSFPEGTGSNQNWDGEGISLLRALGFNPANASVGGSGILNPSSGGRVNWQDSNRLVDLALNGVTDAITAAASVPSMGVIMMSVNDADQQSANWGGAASYRDAIKKGLWVLIDHWNTQRAGKPLVVFGPTTSNGSPVVLDLYRSRDAGQEAVAGASGGNIWFLDRLDASPKLRDGLLTRVTTTGDTHTSSLLDGLASTAGVGVGTGVWGSGIPDGARVAVVNSSVSVTLDVAATSTLVGTSIQFQFTQTDLYTTNADAAHPNQFGHNLDALANARDLRRLVLNDFT